MKIVEWINLADMCRIGTLKFSHQNYAIILIFVFFQGSQAAEPKVLKKGKKKSTSQGVIKRKRTEKKGMKIAGLKMTRLSQEQAEEHYNEHKGKPFFEGLIEFMTSGPVVVMILRHENAVEKFRQLIGATDPKKAEPGTIRKTFAVSVQMNAVHGSDSPENAVIEANFFFSGIERFY